LEDDRKATIKGWSDRIESASEMASSGAAVKRCARASMRALSAITIERWATKSRLFRSEIEKFPTTVFVGNNKVSREFVIQTERNGIFEHGFTFAATKEIEYAIESFRPQPQ
jgi:hypothetical protein